MRVLGVDGCPGGWVGLLVENGGYSWHGGSFAQLLALGAGVVAVDIPIGLPSGAARRVADVEARHLLGPARSSVFFAPPRVVLEAESQPEATRLSRAAGSVGVSIQTFHILDKVREVDRALQELQPGGRRPQVIEVHPELSLRRLAESRQPGPTAPLVPTADRPALPELPPKMTDRGRRRRLELLQGWLPDLTVPDRRPGRAAADDCLDAAAAAWSARRWALGQAEVLGRETDGAGVPMRIVI